MTAEHGVSDPIYSISYTSRKGSAENVLCRVIWSTDPGPTAFVPIDVADGRILTDVPDQHELVVMVVGKPTFITDNYVVELM